MTNQRHSDEFRARARWLNFLTNSESETKCKSVNKVRNPFHSSNSFSNYNGSFWDWSLDNSIIMFSFIGNSTLRELFTLWECLLRDRCLNPYRITPIHWLMARRRLWRNHVVSLYWRTRHTLVRFLCLHEAVTLPFVVAIFWPNLLRSSICTSATTSVELCSPRGEVP